MDPDAPLDPLMSIGAFSRASLVSIRTLRAYHDQGLLVPAAVDPVTGYRSYRVSQLTDAQIIKRLRDLDVSLRDVAEIIAARDPEITRKVLAAHEATMRARVADVNRIVDELQLAIESPSLQTPVHIREEPAAHALAIAGRVTQGDDAAFLGDAHGLLSAALDATGAVPHGPGAALYPAAFESEDDVEVVADVPIAAPVHLPEEWARRGVTLRLIPAVTAAVMTHAGSYESIGTTYRQLGAWVARHARPLDAPVREHYTVSVDPTTRGLLPAEQLRTEIAWPVHPGGPDTDGRGAPP